MYFVNYHILFFYIINSLFNALIICNAHLIILLDT